MASIFDTIRKSAGDKEKSVNWYRSKVRQLASRISSAKLMRQGNVVARPRLFDFCMFSYDPKLKRKLPYYDRFPLVFIIELYEDGFLGMNFHYLPYNLRARLLEELDNRNFRRNYSQLKRIKLIRPTIKRYLRAHYRSGFMRLEKDDYIPAIFMPVAKFEKASESRVFADSRRMVS
mgnify:CR=1 FL=1|jgi:hypothetical protein